MSTQGVKHSKNQWGLGPEDWNSLNGSANHTIDSVIGYHISTYTYNLPKKTWRKAPIVTKICCFNLLWAHDLPWAFWNHWEIVVDLTPQGNMPQDHFEDLPWMDVFVSLWACQRWVKELTKESSGKCTYFIILWMEEILHHLDGWNPKNNGINRLSTGADFFYPPYFHVFSEICMISCGKKDMVAPDWPTVAESGQLNFSRVAFFCCELPTAKRTGITPGIMNLCIYLDHESYLIILIWRVPKI
jgi:hypothetical protein